MTPEEIAKKLEKRGYIKLLPEDFVDVNSKSRTKTQYSNTTECPIACAIRREFKPDFISVCGIGVKVGNSFEDCELVLIGGAKSEVERCRKSLANGSNYAKIRIFDDYAKCYEFDKSKRPQNTETW